MLRRIKSGEHALIVGQTGSGKSVMLQALLKRSTIAPVFVMDAKNDEGFLTIARPDETIDIFDEGLDAFRKLIQGPGRKIPDYLIIRPPIDEVIEPYTLDEYLFLIYAYFKGPCVVAVDELYMLHKSCHCAHGLSAMLTRGRSAGKSLYGATQRPAFISRFCLSEATHYYVFRLIDIDDRKRLTHIGYDKNNIVERYHYYNYDALTGNGRLFEPLPFIPELPNSDIDKKGWL